MLASAHMLCLPMVWCPSISGVKSPRLGLMPKEFDKGVGVGARLMPQVFGVWGSVLGLSTQGE